MKSIQIIKIIIFCLAVTSCSNKIFLQRKYTKGHYFARSSSINQNQKVIGNKTEWVKVVKEQPAELTSKSVTLLSEDKEQTVKKIAFSKPSDSQKSSTYKELQKSNTEVFAIKKNVTQKQSNQAKKKADLNTAVMSWAYAQFAGSILTIPLLLVLASGSTIVTTGIFIISMLLILLGTALAVKSINLGNESLRGDGGFFSKVLGFWGLLNGAAAFVLAFVVFILLIAMI